MSDDAGYVGHSCSSIEREGIPILQEIYSPAMLASDSNARQHVVLVADDNESLRKMLADLLTLEGHRVVCAADGDEALQLIRSQHVDLVLSDVVMPRCGGFAAP